MRRELVVAVATVVGAAGAGLVSAATTPTVEGFLAASPTPASAAAAPSPTATPVPSPVLTPVPPITGPASPVVTPHPPATVRHASPTVSPQRRSRIATPAPRAAAPVHPQATTAATVQEAMRAVLPSARVGFEVFDRKAGTVLTSQHADQRFAAMSQVKLLIAVDVLARDNGPSLGSAMTQQLHQLLAHSDDQIANKLWIAGGGPAIVTRVASRLGLSGTRPPSDPGEWGDTQITAQDMVTVYRYITDRLPEPDRDVILTALADTTEIATDGFDQYFGIPDGIPQIRRAIKQGWGTSGSAAVMNSTGLVGSDWRYVVIVLASAPAKSYSAVPAVVTAGARALAGLVSQAPS